MNKIAGFFGEYRFLSNFWPANVTLDGVDYPTVEHAYQAAKTLDIEERMEVLYNYHWDQHGYMSRTIKSSAQAKRQGKLVTMRADWSDVKIQIMTHLLRQKFSDRNFDLVEALLETGSAELEETNTWGDVFWGVCNGKGSNHLGKILMQIRADLRNDALEF